MNGCWACGGASIRSIYQLESIPISSLILIDDSSEAISYPRMDLELVVCTDCGLIFNQLFRPEAIDYTMPYEESQAFSPRFREYEESLSDRLIEGYDLRGGDIFEIGCGKGSFLQTICRRAHASGLGIDPSFQPERVEEDVAITVLPEFFDEDFTHLTGDLICCRHTLEHIQPVGEFVSLIHRSASQREGCIVYVEVPDTDRILDEGAFWDVYYEHCSYFTAPALSNLFRSHGFAELRLGLGFDEQYLQIDASPGEVDLTIDADAVSHIVSKAERFGECAREAVRDWRTLIGDYARTGGTTVLWGASSKAVGFLAAVGLDEAVTAAVDINPVKQGKFLPGSGHSVIGPEALVDLRPDLVIVMNPVYVSEIGGMLRDLGLSPEIRALGTEHVGEGASLP